MVRWGESRAAAKRPGVKEGMPMGDGPLVTLANCSLLYSKVQLRKCLTTQGRELNKLSFKKRELNKHPIPTCTIWSRS